MTLKLWISSFKRQSKRKGSASSLEEEFLAELFLPLAFSLIRMPFCQACRADLQPGPRFYWSCGTHSRVLATSDPSQQPLFPSAQIAKGMSRRRKIGIIVSVLAVTLAILGAVEVYSTPTPHVNLTAVNLQIAYPTGTDNVCMGPASQSLVIPRNVKAGNQFTVSWQNPNSGPPYNFCYVNITSIRLLTSGFSIVGVSPAPPPILIFAGDPFYLDLTVLAPNRDYSGPLDVQFIS